MRLLTRFYKVPKQRKNEIKVVIGWALATTIILIRVYLSFYIFNPIMVEYGVAYSADVGPMLTWLDLSLLLVVSTIAGMILADLEKIIFGHIASTILSFSIAVACALLYIWFVLGFSSFTKFAFGWEWIFLFAFLNIFKLVFPLTILICFLGAFVGGLLRSWMKP